MKYNNAIIHYYEKSPYIVKAGVNIRNNAKIVLQAALKDDKAAESWLARSFPGMPHKIIVHK